MASKLIEAELKTTRVVPFSGKKEDWDMWQIKHVGRARVRGTYGVLMGTTKMPIIAAGKAATDDEKEIYLNTILSRTTTCYSLVAKLLVSTWYEPE